MRDKKLSTLSGAGTIKMALLFRSGVKRYQMSETNSFIGNELAILLPNLREFGEKLSEIVTAV